MNLDILKIKKDYLRRILEISLNNRDYSTVVFNASFCLDEIKDIIEEIKNEFNIDNVIFVDFDNEKIKAFYESNPSIEEIEQFIPKFSKPIGNLKIIYFSNSITDFSDNYNSNYARTYYKHLKEYNKELFEGINNAPKNDITVAACPNKDWANGLYGNENQLDDLWVKIYNTLLSEEEAKKEIEKRIQLKDELNKMNIYNLHFYTDLGTDFKVSLNPHSIWVCEPNDIKGAFNFFNFPSYEIYTSPNCYSTEGKIVLSKKCRFYYDTLVDNAIFEFSKGRLINSESNSDIFDSVILNKPNKMNRLGEIALVSQSSILAKTGDFYDSVLFDENTGCHFALGYSLNECIGIDKEKLEQKGARYYRYNTSKYHTDFVFGNDSIVVEAETRSKEKVLLMEKGMWKI